MKKLVLILAVLVAAPVFAMTVSLEAGAGPNTVDLKYNADGDANQPRAFAFTVSVTDGKISAVAPAVSGESEVGNKGFGIFPGTIDLTDVNNPVWNSPVAPANDPGASGTGLGTTSVVVEMGSLYAGARGDGNEPDSNGVLCTFTIDCTGVSGDITVSAVEEDQYRGGVVLEDGSTPDPNLTASLVYSCGSAPACATCRGDWNGDGQVDLNTDLLPMLGKLNAAKYFTGSYNYTEADTVTYAALAPWKPCADWNGDGTVDLNTDMLPMLGKLNMAKYFKGAYTYTCGDSQIDP